MFTVRVKTPASKPVGPAGRLGLSLFFLLFGGLGLLFTGFIVKTVWDEWQSRGWRPTPCRIVESRIARDDQGNGDYQFNVRYEYRWEGRRYESTRWRLQGGGFRDYSKAQALVERYPAGRDAQCRVNPAAPTEAILETGSLAVGAVVFFPLIFVAIGVGGLWFTWRAPRSPEAAAPLSAAARALGRARWLPVGFCALFVAMGLGFLIPLFVLPLVKISAARSWPAVPCVVESSRVRAHSDSEGTTYSVDILYRYEFNGRTYRANRYDFTGGSSSGRAGKQAIVNRHPPGHRTVCYVNPANPAEAVLQRGFSGLMWFGLIPLVFVVFGAVALRHTLRAARTPGGRRPSEPASRLRAEIPASPGAAETRELQPTATPAGKALALAFFALFWNGIVSVFVYQVIAAFARGRPEWFLTIFLIPFVVIGLGLVAAAIYSFLALFNPRPRVRLTPGSGRLGGELRLDWAFTGAVHRLERLRLTIEGRESAAYRRGTNTVTDTSVFARVPVLETADRTALRAGQATVRLPAEAVAPSFTADNNKVQWWLCLHGVIGRWPDVREEFPFEVRPAPAGPPDAPGAESAPAEPVRNAAGDIRLGVRGGRRQFRPGEVIEGVAGWSLARAPRLAAVRLLWFTSGKGTRDVEVVEAVDFPAPTREMVQPFRFTLPEGPVSFEGRLVALHWALELVLEPGHDAVRWEFALTPAGAPPVLAALPDERLERARAWYERLRRQR